MNTLTRFDAKISTTVHKALLGELFSSDSPRATFGDVTVVLGKNGLWDIYDGRGKALAYSLTTYEASQVVARNAWGN